MIGIPSTVATHADALHIVVSEACHSSIPPVVVTVPVETEAEDNAPASVNAPVEVV